MSLVVHLDLETRSACSLKSCGSHKYACHESTRIMLAGVSQDGEDAVHLFVHPDFETSDMLSDPRALDLLRRADLVYAHNTGFEEALLWGRGLKDLGLEVPISKWRCTAAMARKAALPWALDKLAIALGLEQQKDTRGKRLIKIFCEPQKDGQFVDPRTRPLEWTEFGEYCMQDVRTEKAVHKKLAAFELTGAVLESFQFDLRMNSRGIPVCVPALQNAQKIIDDVERTVTREFVALTGVNPTQREVVRKLVGLENMQAETITEALRLYEDYNLNEKQRQILRLYTKLSYAAVKKVGAMLDCVCPDGAVRGGHLWYGTGPGRHSGRLFQPQNFKKTPPELRSVTHQVYARIAAGDSAEDLSCIYGEPYELISACIRHFIHKPGTEFLDGDYSAIQARIICWLAGQLDALERYRAGKDTYKWMATRIYGITEEQVTADQREVAKRVVLGAGFQMGPPKFQATCLEQYGLALPIELCELGIKAFRKTHDKVVAFWYTLDADARRAIGAPGVKCGRFTVRQLAGMPYLLMQLPSGRSIAYPRPRIVPDPMFDTQIVYWGPLQNSVHYGDVKLYPGKFAENLTMGVEADIMNHGLITAEKRGMPPFMLVHDQALALRLNGKTAKDFASALVDDLPAWAKGLPVKVDAREAPYYQKS